MSEQKHFKYEAKEPQITSPDLGEVEITDLRFLTPAKVSMKVDGVQTEEILSIDLITRRAYKGNKEVVYSDKVFDYLDAINSLPENFSKLLKKFTNRLKKLRQNMLKCKI